MKPRDGWYELSKSFEGWSSVKEGVRISNIKTTSENLNLFVWKIWMRTHIIVEVMNLGWTDLPISLQHAKNLPFVGL